GLLEGMAKIGYKVVNVGDRDLGLGYDDFITRTKGSPIQFISANVVREDTKQTVFRPYTVVELKQAGSKKPLRVAVTGARRYSPAWLKAGPDKSNLAIDRPADRVRAILPEMKKASDLVVVLAAMSKPEASQLANDVSGIDVIIGAYGGVYNASEEMVGGA